MSAFSVMNVDARYSVSQELALIFIESWAAKFEDEILGFFATRTLAEHMCKWHYTEALVAEEA